MQWKWSRTTQHVPLILVCLKCKKKQSKMNFVEVKFTREEHYMITQTITIMEDINFVNKKYSRLSLILFTLI